MLSIGNKKYRNLQEQVGYNTECIQKLAEAIDGITLEDKLVIIANDSGTFTEEEMTVLNGPLAFISDGSKVWLKQSETASEFVFKAIDIVATEVGGTYFNVGGSKIVVTKATRAYVIADDLIITTYDKTQIEALLSTKASLSGANFTGEITAPSIIENMSGYSVLTVTKENITITFVYAGVVKTGNKMTISIFLKLNRSDTVAENNIIPCYIDIPSAIGEKLFPENLGGFSVLSAQVVDAFSGITAHTEVSCIIRKISSTRIHHQILGVNSLTANTDYLCRIETTFLLSDNLAE